MVNYTDDLGSSLIKAVEQSLADKIRAIVEEEALAAGERAKKRVRELAVETCAHIRSKVDMHFFNSREIHIKLTLDNKP